MDQLELKKKIEELFKKVDDTTVGLSTLIGKIKGEWADDIKEEYEAFYDSVGNMNALLDIDIDKNGKIIEE